MRRPPRLAVEPLEDRLTPAPVTFTIDPAAGRQPISRFVYGINTSLAGSTANLTLERLGGNRWTAYNWETNASNAGSDYQYQNDGYLGGGTSPGGAVAPTLQDAAAHDAAALVTVPLVGYVSADKNGDGDVRNSGPNYLQTRFRQERPAKGAPFSLTPDPTDGYVYADEFVNWVNSTFPGRQSDPTRPIWYSLDNEPDLWSSTHAEVHPAALTYAELVQRTTDYAAAVKAVAPGSLVFGPVNYGWNGFTTLQDAPDAGGRDFQSYYLARLKAADGTWLRLLRALQGTADELGMIDWAVFGVDTMVARAGRAAGGGKTWPPGEPADHALGRGRGGFGTKLHLMSCGNGLPVGVGSDARPGR